MEDNGVLTFVELDAKTLQPSPGGRRSYGWQAAKSPQGRVSRLSPRAKAVRHSSAPSERRRTILRQRPNLSLRPADAGATAGTPAKEPTRPGVAFVPTGEGCPP